MRVSGFGLLCRLCCLFLCLALPSSQGQGGDDLAFTVHKSPVGSFECGRRADSDARPWAVGRKALG